MGETTPDIRQLSTCCGKVLVWSDYEHAEIDGVTVYEARCSECKTWEHSDINKDGRPLSPVEKLILARIAELEATLANERGEGEAPCEGWGWVPEEEQWAHGGGLYVFRRPKGWTWDGDRVSSGRPHFDTARAVIRAASSQGADAPKEG